MTAMVKASGAAPGASRQQGPTTPSKRARAAAAASSPIAAASGSARKQARHTGPGAFGSGSLPSTPPAASAAASAAVAVAVVAYPHGSSTGFQPTSRCLSLMESRAAKLAAAAAAAAAAHSRPSSPSSGGYASAMQTVSGVSTKAVGHAPSSDVCCGAGSGCLNRVCQTECPVTCPFGDLCENQRFRRRQWANVQERPVRKGKGRGAHNHDCKFCVN